MTPKEEVLAMAHDMTGEGATTTAIALAVARYAERRAMKQAENFMRGWWFAKPAQLPYLPSEYDK